MLLFSFSALGIVLLVIGHVFHFLFLAKIKKISLPNESLIINKENLKAVFFYIISITIFITASVYATPSTVGVIFAFFIILYDLYYFTIIKNETVYFFIK